jgi:hypothetical protein
LGVTEQDKRDQKQLTEKKFLILVIGIFQRNIGDELCDKISQRKRIQALESKIVK